MQNPKLGDACFVMSATYSNDHDWGDNVSYDLNLRLMMNMFAIILKVGLEECQL